MKNVLTIFLLILFISGCSFGENASQDKQDERVKVQNSVIEHEVRKKNDDKSRHLAKLAESVPEVENATAIVIGNLAVVGIDVKGNLERSEVGSIKYSVAESMKDDPFGANAMVVAGPDLTARLKEVAEDFRSGQPLQGIMNELADITGRVMPEVPADIIEPNPKNATEEPKKELNNNEEQNLDEKQDRQSNYHKNN